MLAAAFHCLHGEPPVSAEPHHAAGKDRSVTPRQIKLVGRLLIEPGDKSFPVCPFLALGEHIAGVIAAIHVHTCRQVRQQESSRPAAKVQGRLSKCIDHCTEVRSFLAAIGLELRPITSNQTVVPNLWLCHFLSVSFSIKSISS